MILSPARSAETRGGTAVSLVSGTLSVETGVEKTYSGHGIDIRWNTKAARQGGPDGARLRDVLDVVIRRLGDAQASMPCKEHDTVLDLLRQAQSIHIEIVDRADKQAGAFEHALLG